MKQKAIALHSGGLDSTVAARLAMRDAEIVLTLTFDYGQRAAAQEIRAARAFCERHRIEHRPIDIPWLAGLGASALTNRGTLLPRVSADSLDVDAKARAKAVWVPNRNGLFIAIAASFAEAAGASLIVTGFNAEEAATFPDNGAGFIEATDRTLAFSTQSGVKLLCPTQDMKKAKIAAEFISFDIPPESFWCCYEGGERLCGECESCARTIRAFKSAGGWDLISDRFDTRHGER